MKTNLKDSGVELLRTISIYCIVIVHIIMLILEPPGHEALLQNPVSTATTIFFLSFSIICVDVFVIISGWYGIHATTKGLAKLMFQCVFFALCSYALAVITDNSYAFSPVRIVKLIFYGSFPGWFIAAYIVLYILSPIINKFVENTPKADAQRILAALFSFIFLYGWILTDCSGNESTFQSGYSAIFLLALYVLVRFVKRHYFDTAANATDSPQSASKSINLNTISKEMWLFAWLGVLALNVVIWLVTTRLNIGQISSRLFMYTSPLVMVQSFCMFRFFQMLKFKSVIVNKIGFSSLAIMLMHYWKDGEYLKRSIFYISDNYNGMHYLMHCLLLLLALGLLAIALDQVRILCWSLIEKRKTRVEWLKWRNLYY